MNKKIESRQSVQPDHPKPLKPTPPQPLIDHLIDYIFKIDYRQEHDIITGLIADALDEIGFETYLEYHVPYTIKALGGLKTIDGRIDLFATNGSYTIACEVEGERLPLKSLRKLYKKRDALKLIVMRGKASKHYLLPVPIQKIPGLMVLNLYTKQIDWPKLPPHRQTFREELVEG